MKTFWKALGVTALAVGLSPYRVTLDKSTGEKKIRALLWKATCGSRSSGRGLSLDFGFFPPNEEEEAHLFADELVVHYHNGQPCYADDESCCADSSTCTQEDGPYACCKACQESQEVDSAPEAEAEPPQEACRAEDAPAEAPAQPEEP